MVLHPHHPQPSQPGVGASTLAGKAFSSRGKGGASLSPYEPLSSSCRKREGTRQAVSEGLLGSRRDRPAVLTHPLLSPHLPLCLCSNSEKF